MKYLIEGGCFISTFRLDPCHALIYLRTDMSLILFLIDFSMKVMGTLH